jgi:hypothetical protein
MKYLVAGISLLLAIVAGVVVSSASGGSPGTAITTTGPAVPSHLSTSSTLSTFTITTGGTFYPVTITLLNKSVSLVPGSAATLLFRVSSPVAGTFYTTLSEPNAFASPSLAENNNAGVVLPTSVQTTYPSGAVISGQSQVVLPVTIAIGSSAQAGVLTLQLTVFQHQSSQPGGYIEADVPVLVEVA